MSDFSKIAKKAANIWGSEIYINSLETEDESLDVIISTFIRGTNTIKITQKDVNNFVLVLTHYIEAKLKEEPNKDLRLTTDYTPEVPLRSLCTESGLHPSALPIKSVMWVSVTKIVYKFVYSDDWVTIETKDIID